MGSLIYGTEVRGERKGRGRTRRYSSWVDLGLAILRVALSGMSSRGDPVSRTTSHLSY